MCLGCIWLREKDNQSNHGMKTDVIARLINEKGLYQRWDGKPVDGKQVYACIIAHPDTFVKSEGLIRLMI